MKKIYLESLLDFLPDDAEIYIRVGDKAWPAKARVFDNISVLYLEQNVDLPTSACLDFPENQSGVNEAKIPQPYDPDHEQDAPCGACTHPYYRHFDPFEDDAPVGCKHCGCCIFQEE